MTVKQLGPNHSGLNGKMIGMGETETAVEGDNLELLWGNKRLTYKLTFQTPPGSPPKKIAKIFLPKGTADEFKKNGLLEFGSWHQIGANELVVYSLGENIKEPKPNVSFLKLTYI